MFSKTLQHRATQLLATCRKRKVMLVTAESCTGGLIAALLTEIAGSSDVFERGFVTYSNLAKETLLSVPHKLLETHGAVSEQTAQAMALGALKHSNAQLAISVTGIAGPSGGTAKKPVGLVYIGVAYGKHVTVVEKHFSGTRARIRASAVGAALALAMDALTQ